MTPRRSDAGFTLLEVLVALTVVGFIMVGLQQGLHFGLAASERMERLSRRQDSFGAAERVLRRLIEQAEPAPTGAALLGSPGTLLMRSTLPRLGDGGAPPRSIALGTDAGHRLVLRWHDPAGVAMEEAVLLERIASVEFAYWGTASDGSGGWHRSWDAAEMPRLVRIRLRALEPGRTWPDIVGRPMIEKLAAQE